MRTVVKENERHKFHQLDEVSLYKEKQKVTNSNNKFQVYERQNNKKRER